MKLEGNVKPHIKLLEEDDLFCVESAAEFSRTSSRRCQ